MRICSTLAAATALAALSIPALTLQAEAKNCDWRISGAFNVEHQLDEMKDKFGMKQPLRNIEVRVSGRTGTAVPWGSWGTVRTNGDGEFSLSKNKTCADRYFKVEVKFEDSEIELRHEHSTIPANKKVLWYEAWNSENLGNKKPPSLVELGTLTFGPGTGISGNHERADFQVYRHAELWTVYKFLNDVLEGYGPEYDFERKLVVKYPHNSQLVGEAEASYVNPVTRVTYIHKDGPHDSFKMETLIHEAAHALFYDKFHGEACLTWDLVLTHDTHDLAPNSCSAFHEGAADAFQQRFSFEQFGTAMELPDNRASLASGVGLGEAVPRPNLVERLDEGWTSIFMAMMNEDLGRLEFGTADGTPGAARRGSFVGACSEPKVNLKRMIKVFLSNSEKGFFKDLTQDETRMDPFLSRAAAILANFDEEHANAISAAHDSRLDSEPSDFLCEAVEVVKGDPVGGDLLNPSSGPPRRRGSFKN